MISFNKRYFSCAIFAIIISACLPQSESSSENKTTNPPPNIVFILADDQRNDALGCAGHPIIKTPHIDKLAREGIRFTNAFVTTPICAASRATILTGLTERTHGFTFGKENLSRAEMSFSYPAVLKRSGYRTGFFGKIGVKMDAAPDSLFDVHSFRDRPYLTDLGHIDALNTKEALEFIKTSSPAQPFCLSVSYSSAHAEDGDHIPGEEHHFAVIEPMKGKYQNSIISPPRLADTAIYSGQPEFLKTSLNRVRYHWRWDTPQKYEENMKAYYGLISGIDYMVGQILEQLKKQELDQNTIIIYMADNGYYMGDRGFAGKWSHYEESLRVPLIIYDPRIKNSTLHRTIDRMALNMDIPSTMLDYAGQPIPKEYQGRSLRPFYLEENVDSWRSDFFCEHLMDHPQIPKWEGVRNSRYMYARYFEQNPPFEFLHDLETDPDQLINYRDDENYTLILKDLRKQSEYYQNKYSKEVQ